MNESKPLDLEAIKLKPCPCGAQMRIQRDESSDYASRWYWFATCINQDCGWMFSGFATKEETIKAVNSLKTLHDKAEAEPLQERVISALTQPTVVTTNPKSQGEVRLRQGLEDIVRISTTAIEEKNPELMVKIAIKALREAVEGQNACTRGDDDELDKMNLEMILSKAAIEEALTQRPVVHIDHRLTESELDKAEKIYHSVRDGRMGSINTFRMALEIVIRDYLKSLHDTQPTVVKESLTTEAEGLVRTMYAMLKTDQTMGIDLLPSERSWMVNAETWIKSLHDTKDEQREPLKPLCEEG